MREPKRVRYLTSREKNIARQVFKNTIPYDDVVVTDGLGGGNRPFAVPTSMPIRIPFYANFNVSQGKYALHVGDGYYGMSTLDDDKELLIHELTHVWQGENDTSWSWAYVLMSLKDQAVSHDAYHYDEKRLEPWTHYGPEQQAEIVAHWYKAGMKSFDPATQEGDRRFYYIKKHIRKERVRGNWLIVPIRPIGAGELKMPLSYPDAFAIALLPLLNQKIREGDHTRIAARLRKLEAYFDELGPSSAEELYQRLQAKRKNDELAQAFGRRLATATRRRLLHRLRETFSH